MKIMMNRFFTVLLLSTLTFFLMLQFPLLAFEEESNGVMLTYGKTYKQNLSAHSEAWRTYSLPPAWENPDPKQEESPIYKDLTLAARMDQYRLAN